LNYLFIYFLEFAELNFYFSIWVKRGKEIWIHERINVIDENIATKSNLYNC